MSSRRPIAAIVRGLLPALLVLVSVLDVRDAGAAAQLTASWTDNSGGEAAFTIERRTVSEATFTALADVAVGVTSYVDATITAGVTYCYRVKAYNGFGESPYCDEACGSVASDYSVTITSAGTGTGTVSSAPVGITCGSSCTATYAPGTLVTLTATAASGSRFDGWSGACSGTAVCTVTGNAPVTVRATFNRLPSVVVAPAPPPPTTTAPAPTTPTPTIPTPTTPAPTTPPTTTAPAPTTPPTTTAPAPTTPPTTTAPAPTTPTTTAPTPTTTTTTPSTTTTTSTARTPTTTPTVSAPAVTTAIPVAVPTSIAMMPSTRSAAAVPSVAGPALPSDYSRCPGTEPCPVTGTGPTGVTATLSQLPSKDSPVDTRRPPTFDPDRPGTLTSRAVIDARPAPRPTAIPVEATALTGVVPAAARPWMAAVQSVTTDINAPYRLVVRVTKRTWIRVRMDNGQVTEEKLKAGGKLMWVSNRPFVISIGNAGGVRLELNGRRLPSPDGVPISDLMLPQ